MKKNFSILTLLFAFTACMTEAAQQWMPSFNKGVNIAGWMVYYPEGAYADAGTFNEQDVAWIAKQGFDHIRIPVDGSILAGLDGKLIRPMLRPLDQALTWASQHKLGVVVDLHVMPGIPVALQTGDDAHWTNPLWRDTLVGLWAQIARAYREEGTHLRFEILTMASPPTAEIGADLNRRVVEAIHAENKERVVYVAAYRTGNFDYLDSMPLFPENPRVQQVLHFFEPLMFTLQGVPWDQRFANIKRKIPFPFQLDNLGEYFPPGDSQLRYNNQLIDEEFIDAQFARAGAWAKKHEARVYISEFAVYRAADAESTERYIRALRRASERHGFAWAVWDYNGEFAVRRDGKTTAVWKGLFSENERQ